MIIGYKYYFCILNLKLFKNLLIYFLFYFYYSVIFDKTLLILKN